MISGKPFYFSLSGIGMVVLLTTLCTDAFSQSRQYFNRYWKPTEYEEHAAYYRTVKEEGGKFIVKTYRLSDEGLLLEAECQAVEPALVYDGKVVNYYNNGTVKNQGFYKKGKKSGIFKYFNEDGTPLSEQSCREDDCKYIQYWTGNGKPSIVRGAGIATWYNKEKKYTEQIEFLDSIAICNYAIRPEKGDTVYYNYGLVVPFFKAGNHTLYNRIRKYPIEAQRIGIEGEVVAEFVVNLEGTLEDIKIVRGIGYGCDEAVLECMKKNSKGWEPAKYKGKLVKSQVMLPFTFKLTDDN